MYISRRILLGSSIALLTSCRLVMSVDEGGQIVSDSGNYNCTRAACSYDVPADGLSESFSAVADAGYEFVGWEKACKDTTGACNLNIDSTFAEYTADIELIAKFRDENLTIADLNEASIRDYLNGQWFSDDLSSAAFTPLDMTYRFIGSSFTATITDASGIVGFTMTIQGSYSIGDPAFANSDVNASITFNINRVVTYSMGTQIDLLDPQNSPYAGSLSESLQITEAGLRFSENRLADPERQSAVSNANLLFARQASN